MKKVSFWVCLKVYLDMCVCVCVYVYDTVCNGVPACVYTVCVFMCLCVCVCVCVCVWWRVGVCVCDSPPPRLAERQKHGQAAHDFFFLMTKSAAMEGPAIYLSLSLAWFINLHMEGLRGRGRGRVGGLVFDILTGLAFSPHLSQRSLIN